LAEAVQTQTQRASNFALHTHWQLSHPGPFG
jgi:hypothetical protein